MHYEESTELGEKLLNQALRALNSDLANITDEQWDKLLRDITAKSRLELFADIGLGKRFAAVVARRLLAASEQAPAEGNAGPIVIRGSEGMAVQFAKCCRPIPGDPIIGSIKKGQGIVVHTLDCPSATKSRTDPDKWLDVEWAPEPARLFDVGIQVAVMNQRGVLAKVAGAIAADGANINGISMDEDRSAYTNMHFTLQVVDRQHLARIKRGLRRIPEVVRISRSRD
jgi:GTP pyrophosphokinase